MYLCLHMCAMPGLQFITFNLLVCTCVSFYQASSVKSELDEKKGRSLEEMSILVSLKEALPWFLTLLPLPTPVPSSLLAMLLAEKCLKRNCRWLLNILQSKLSSGGGRPWVSLLFVLMTVQVHGDTDAHTSTEFWVHCSGFSDKSVCYITCRC